MKKLAVFSLLSLSLTLVVFFVTANKALAQDCTWNGKSEFCTGQTANNYCIDSQSPQAFTPCSVSNPSPGCYYFTYWNSWAPSGSTSPSDWVYSCYNGSSPSTGGSCSISGSVSGCANVDPALASAANQYTQAWGQYNVGECYASQAPGTGSQSDCNSDSSFGSTNGCFSQFSQFSTVYATVDRYDSSQSPSPLYPASCTNNETNSSPYKACCAVQNGQAVNVGAVSADSYVSSAYPGAPSVSSPYDYGGCPSGSQIVSGYKGVGTYSQYLANHPTVSAYTSNDACAVLQPPSPPPAPSSTPPTSSSTPPGGTGNNTQHYYYCKTTPSDSCIQTSNTYSSASACESALQQYLPGQTTGVCYPDNGSCSSSCPSSSSPTPTPAPTPTPSPGGSTPTPPPPKSSSPDLSISITPNYSCLPRNGVTNSTNINWSVSVTNSCPSGYTETQGSDTAACSGNLPGGPAKGPSSGTSNVTISQTTNYSISCTRGSYVCSQNYQCDPHEEVITNTDGSTSTQTVYDTCTRTKNISGSSASNYTTVHYVNPPTIESFSANPSHILLNKSTYLSWISQVFSQDNTIPTGQYCYPSRGGSGDLSGWNIGQKYGSADQTSPLTPQKTTTYDLTCRNYDTNDTSCYNESAQNTSVNVYGTSINETNPSALIQQAWNIFLKGLGL
ncbi:MAG: hypothetical protein KGJ01_01910 [Patescibacteria group bacterium]|nr:hypothetical protein [Patescibacteria group bacterium]